jgi:hypothetical protein
MHATTLKQGWVPHTDPCECFVKAPITADNLIEHGPAGWLVHAWLVGELPAQGIIKRLKAKIKVFKPAP